jgi:hypothetical protein
MNIERERCSKLGLPAAERAFNGGSICHGPCQDRTWTLRTLPLGQTYPRLAAIGRQGILPVRMA